MKISTRRKVEKGTGLQYPKWWAHLEERGGAAGKIDKIDQEGSHG
jgi:hypothetical protein